jgi:uncharacterized membrane protein YjjP (DUF1212 family)
MEMDNREAGELLHLMLDMGEMLMNSGAEVNRVEDTITRLGAAYGAARTDVFAITSSIVVTIAFPDGMELTRTRRILTSGGTDFSRLEKLNALSRQCCAAPMTAAELRRRLDAIRASSAGGALYCLGAILAAGSFAVFFGGTFFDGITASVFAVIILILQRHLAQLCPNNVIFNLISSFIVGAGICAVARFIPQLNADKIMIGDIMLLIPGIAMTNSVRDVLVGDTIYGIMRLIESLLWAGALACGFMAAIWLIGG